MKRVFVFVLTVLLLVPAAAVFAQKKGEPTTRSVRGVVTDAGDAPVAGAVVQLENTKTQQIRSYITKEDGAYSFFELNTDTDYKLRAEFKGASSSSKTLSSFDSRKQAVVNLKLDKK
jgi:hypothetical protein